MASLSPGPIFKSCGLNQTHLPQKATTEKKELQATHSRYVYTKFSCIQTVTYTL